MADKYVGDTADGDTPTATALYYYDSGDKYTGNWEHGKQCGHGVYVYANGDRYVGNWAGGKHHGEGTYYFKSGKIFQGAPTRRARRQGHGCFHVHERREARRRVERLGVPRLRHLHLRQRRPVRRLVEAGEEARHRHLLLCVGRQVPGRVQGRRAARLHRGRPAVFIEADGRAFNEEWSGPAGGRRKARTAITTVKYEAGPSADAKAAEDAARSPPNHAAVGMGPTTPPVAASTKVPASAHASTPPISPLVDVDGVACAPAAAAASKGAYAPDADFDAFFTAPPAAGMAPAAAPATDSSLLDLLGSPDAAPTTAAATVVSGPDLLL